MAKIFISYRRADSASISGRIYDRLVATFGRDNVFKDVDNTPPGVDFSAYIKQSLRECAVELVVIGPSWLDIRNEEGERRLDNPSDFVRIEVEMALGLGLTVMPLLVEGAQVPRAEELPDSLRKLAQINIVPVRNDPDFRHDIERVIAAIQRQHPAGGGLPAPEGQRGEAAPSQSPTPFVPAGNRAAPGWPGAPLPAGGGARRPSTAVAALERPSKAKSKRARWLIGGGVTVVLVVAIVLVLLRGIGLGGPAATRAFLNGVTMVSATDGWAVGSGSNTPSDGETILHYTGGQWTTVTSPVTTPLSSVAMVSATDGWAVGSNGAILHYSGGRWATTTVASPTIPYLTSVAMVSATDGWAVGNVGAILHYIGGQWTTVTSPVTTPLSSVAMVSATDGWAVGNNGAILHYSGERWATVKSPTPAPIDSVAMVSALEGWAVGLSGTILHYSGGEWTTVKSPTALTLYSVSMISATEGWAVGDLGTIVHYSGGQWTKVTSPVTAPPLTTPLTLSSVAMVSATDGWAVGLSGTILHYSGGQWTKVTSPSS